MAPASWVIALGLLLLLGCGSASAPGGGGGFASQSDTTTAGVDTGTTGGDGGGTTGGDATTGGDGGGATGGDATTGGDGTSTPSQVCQPQALACDGGKVVRCNADGLGQTLVEDCAAKSAPCVAGACGSKADCAVITPIGSPRLNTPLPGTIAVAFTVSTCGSASVPPAPLTGLKTEQFVVKEDGKSVSATESAQQLVDRNLEAYVTIVMDNSPSVAETGALQDAVAAAKAYAKAVLANASAERKVQVQVMFFSKALEVKQPFTSDSAAVLAALDLLLQGGGSSTTNLYGATVEAIAASQKAQQARATAMKGGVNTIGQVLIFTDGSDQAAKYTLEQAQQAVDATPDDVLTIAFSGDANNEIEPAVIKSLGKSGSAIATSAAALTSVFAELAERTTQLQKRIYILGYCSPKLAGEHELTIELKDIPTKESIGVTFNADSFDVAGASCSAAAFASACDGKGCGGLFCGGCEGQSICDDKLQCSCPKPGFAAPACTSCLPQFDGPDCADCSEKYSGPGCSTCKPPWGGPQCDVCAKPGPYCVASTVKQCSADMKSIQTVETCQAPDNCTKVVCVDGACQTTMTAPNGTSCSTDGSKWCQSGKCVLNCTPYCDGSVPMQCNAEGTKFVAGAACEAPDSCSTVACVNGGCTPPSTKSNGTSCSADGSKWCQSGTCVLDCTPYCDGSVPMQCNAEGTKFVAGAACEAPDSCTTVACVNGGCKTTSTKSNGTSCSTDGSKWCQSGKCVLNCTPYCDGSVPMQCNAEGTKFVAGAACEAPDSCTTVACVNGGCKTTSTKSNGTSCSADGSKWCQSGTCVPNPCPGGLAVEVDIDGKKEVVCSALGPVWGNRPDKPVNVYEVKFVANQPVVNDSQTKLMWQQGQLPSALKWAPAKSYCDGLVYAGHKDWRLPSVHELATLVDYSIETPGPMIDAVAFPGTQPIQWWTASPYTSFYVWVVNFSNGNLGNLGNINTAAVRCVRGSAPPAPGNRYAISAGGGVVADNWTKLQWQRAVVAGKKNWSNAKSYCSGLSLEGSGWRLPTIRELHGLVDKQESKPKIDKTAFPNTPSQAFWSASARAGSNTSAWLVIFSSGSVSSSDITGPREVRCVRGS